MQGSVLFSILQGSVLLRAVFVGLFSELTGSFKAFSLAFFSSAIVVSGFALFSIS